MQEHVELAAVVLLQSYITILKELTFPPMFFLRTICTFGCLVLINLLIFFLISRSDDEETFCRTLVEYTRACSHVGYPVREWRDSFPTCGQSAFMS